MSYDYKDDSRAVKIQARLQIVSFFSGSATMILELTGSRLVAPFFGTSLIVWTALIGIIMTSLCIGNWLGGSLADKRPEGKLLGRILMFAAIIIAITAFASNYILTTLQGLNLNLYMASVAAAVAIFSPASILLGMVSPFVARLAMQNVSSSGGVVGRLSALNSAGSILGTFMGGFVLISLFPSGVILMLIASLVALLSVLVYTGAWRKIIAVLVACALGAGAFAADRYGIPFSPRGIQIDTAYNHLSVIDYPAQNTRTSRPIRVLVTNPDSAQSMMYLDDTSELVSSYTKFYDLAFYYKPDTKRVLMLGGGGYCVPRYLLATRPDVSIDVVELDPGVTETARKYFDLKDSPNLRIFHEDARTFLNRAKRDGIDQYDAIFMDTFTSWISIPFQMTTVETAAKLRELLKPDGALIVNIIAALYGPKSGVFHGIYKAFANSFNTMMIFPAYDPDPKYAYVLQNIILVGMDAAVSPAPEAKFSGLLSHQWLEPFTPDPVVPAFRDSFAPVERYALVQ